MRWFLLSLMLGATVTGCAASLRFASISPARTETPRVGKAAISLPAMISSGDAFRGRQKFVSLGCVQCHSVRGVGGKAGPALDNFTREKDVEPEAFAQEFEQWMEDSAPYMQPLQRMETGATTQLSAQDILDLAAFVSDADAQKGFQASEIPAEMRVKILGAVDLSNDPEDQYHDQEWRAERLFDNERSGTE